MPTKIDKNLPTDVDPHEPIHREGASEAAHTSTQVPTPSGAPTADMLGNKIDLTTRDVKSGPEIDNVLSQDAELERVRAKEDERHEKEDPNFVPKTPRKRGRKAVAEAPTSGNKKQKTLPYSPEKSPKKNTPATPAGQEQPDPTNHAESSSNARLQPSFQDLSPLAGKQTANGTSKGKERQTVPSPRDSFESAIRNADTFLTTPANRPGDNASDTAGEENQPTADASRSEAARSAWRTRIGQMSEEELAAFMERMQEYSDKKGVYSKAEQAYDDLKKACDDALRMCDDARKARDKALEAWQDCLFPVASPSPSG